MSGSPDPKKPPRRRRRTPESARREILDAAERQLVRQGPDGLRLQAIANDLGISHASILHHFGSRDGLLDALSADAFHVLERDLTRSLEAPSADDPATDLFEKIGEILGDRGHARLLAWQIMSRRPTGDGEREGPDDDRLLDRLAQTLHGARREHARSAGLTPPELDETRTIVTLTACAVFGEALAGELMMQSAGLAADAGARRDFRRWIAQLIAREVFPQDPEDAEAAEAAERNDPEATDGVE